MAELDIWYTRTNGKESIKINQSSKNYVVLPDLKNYPGFNHLEFKKTFGHIKYSLDCSKNEIINLNNVPDFITVLDCSKNKIKHLNNLPDSIINLNCSGNFIVNLEYLPNSLAHLNCSHNLIINLEYLPSGLIYLDCSYNKIIKLNNLPNLINNLNCSHNSIAQLNNLPNKIIKVDCSYNLIQTIILPNSIGYINIQYNPLKSRPVINKYKYYLKSDICVGICLGMPTNPEIQLGYYDKFILCLYNMAVYNSCVWIGIYLFIFGLAAILMILIIFGPKFFNSNKN